MQNTSLEPDDQPRNYLLNKPSHLQLRQRVDSLFPVATEEQTVVVPAVEDLKPVEAAVVPE